MEPTVKITDIDASTLGNAADGGLTVTLAVQYDGLTYARKLVYKLPDVAVHVSAKAPTLDDVKSEAVAAADAVRDLRALAVSLSALKDADLIAAAVPAKP